MEPDEITETIPVIAPASHRRLPARGTQFAKLATIGVAGVVLCGAVTMSSMISQQRREYARPQARPAAQITGDRALLPDRLDRPASQTVAPAPEPPPVRPPAAAPTEEPSPPAPSAEPEAADPAPTTGTTDGTTASAGTAAAHPAPSSDAELVREFYDNLPSAPGSAFALLSPDLLEGGFGEFLTAWSSVVSIDSVDVVQRADGVLATVRMHLLDGGELRVRQLLTVAENPRRIVGVELLSAQYN